MELYTKMMRQLLRRQAPRCMLYLTWLTSKYRHDKTASVINYTYLSTRQACRRTYVVRSFEIGRKLAILCAVDVVPSSEIASDTSRLQQLLMMT